MAKLEAELMLSNADEIVCRVYAIKEKYGRTLVDLICDGKDVGEMLIAKGLAREYDGGHKEGWD
jgi:endonuclease YncB( thermonuclease family)